METTVKTRRKSSVASAIRQSKPLTPATKKLSEIDEGIADLKAGRITKIDNPKNLIAECLK